MKNYKLKPNEYIVRRTSLWDKKICPIQEARQESFIIIDERCVSKPEDLCHDTVESWYSYGWGHTDLNGHICRNVGIELRWVMQILDLSDFIEVNGPIILDLVNGNLTLEIYDDYQD